MQRLSAVLSLLALCGALAASVVAGPATGNDHVINAGHEGKTFDYKPRLVPDKLNIVDFYSQYCPPCRAIMPRLEKLTEHNPGVVVLRIDIDRPGVAGIDWDSPVAHQYNLHSIPHFVVYDGHGKQVAIDADESPQASQVVDAMLQKAGL